MVKLIEIPIAAAPAVASLTLSQINEAVAIITGILGGIYLAIGVAMRWRKWRRGE